VWKNSEIGKKKLHFFWKIEWIIKLLKVDRSMSNEAKISRDTFFIANCSLIGFNGGWGGSPGDLN
jgi:hypothetical protein